jgi:protein-disulfide isomerase
MSQKASKQRRQTQRAAPPPPTSSKGGGLSGVPRKWLYGGLAVVAVAAIAVLIVVSLSGGDEAAAPATVDGTETEQMLQGIPQDGVSLGAPAAPVVLAEFADLQCPFCLTFALEMLPKLLDDYVRPGKVRIDFAGLAFLGPDSEKALRYALSAGEQDRLWNVVDLLYVHQGSENSGWVTDELLAGIGAAVPGLDHQAALDGVDSEAVSSQIDETAASAQQKLPKISTPSFLLGKNGGELPYVDLAGQDYESFTQQIDALLAG